MYEIWSGGHQPFEKEKNAMVFTSSENITVLCLCLENLLTIISNSTSVKFPIGKH